MQKRGITNFRSKFFLSQCRKISLGNTSVYQKISGGEKFYASEGYVTISCFRLTVPKKFVWEHFGVSEIFGERKTLCIREGVSSFFIEIILSHSTENIR